MRLLKWLCPVPEKVAEWLNMVKVADLKLCTITFEYCNPVLQCPFTELNVQSATTQYQTDSMASRCAITYITRQILWRLDAR